MMKRVFWILFWVLTTTLIGSAQTTFYYPHVVDGVQPGAVTVTWKTTILLTNPSSTATASGTVTFTKDNFALGLAGLGLAGSPFPITLTDESGASATASVFTFSLGPGATRKYVSAGTGSAGAFAEGFATVSTTAGAVNGTAIFSEFDSAGNLIGEAGVPAASAVARQLVFVDTIGGYNIGVAVANPGGTAAVVTLNLLNSSAVSVVSTTAPLGPGNHGAAFISQLFPTAPAMAGTMQITSPSPLAAIALRFDPTFTKFTTLPPVTLASLINPAIEWLQERPWLTPLTSIARLLGGLQLRIG